MEWDKGPPPEISQIIDNAPLNEYIARPKKFRLAWGPIYYRGRLDGSARVLVIGQDPAADENIARRILVGDAGQRIQGFLAKLGITRSYVMVNSVLYSIYGQFDNTMRTFMDIETVKAWRNQLLDALATQNIEAVLAFGNAAREVVESWPGADVFNQQGRVFYLLHPTARPVSSVLTNWSNKLNAISAKVAPDFNGTLNLTAYTGPNFEMTDLANIPLYDFGFGAPKWLGTGDTAVRLNPSGTVPDSAKQNPSIIFTAIGPEG